MPRPIGVNYAAVCGDPGNESKCNVSGVTTLVSWFHGQATFNGDVSTWSVGSVTDMQLVFHGAAMFNSNLNAWDVSGTTNLAYAFASAIEFNQPLGVWATRSVASLDSTFEGAAAFNQALNDWNISAATTLAETFLGASAFNQALNDWNTAGVTSLRGIFLSASTFNQTLASWDTNNVRSLHRSFERATSFNGDISTWDVSNVLDFGEMFLAAKSFDQDLSRWTLSKNLTVMQSMFLSSKLSTCNKAYMRNQWGAEQNNRAFLEAYSFWPRQCPNTNIKCQPWQKRGIGDNANCEPALWLDAGACMAYVWNGTHSLTERHVGNPTANGTARQEWASPLLDHAPDQVSIKDGGCTHLPGLSQAFKRSMDPAVARFGQHLRSTLSTMRLGDTFRHTAGDGVSALVQFNEGSCDLFVITLKATSKDNSCASSLSFTDGTLTVPLDIVTAVLSLKNISFFSSESMAECHDTKWTPGVGLPEAINALIEDAFATAGRQPGEPEFALTRYPPDYTRKRNDTAPPTMICPLNASLKWPFELSAVVGPDDPDKDHIFQVVVFFI